MSLVTEEDSGDDEVAIAASSSSVVSEVEINNSEVDEALPEYLSDSDYSDVEMGVEEQCVSYR